MRYSKITDCALMSDKVASYSAIDNHLVVADINTGAILISQKGINLENHIIEGLTHGSTHFKDQLCLLTLNTLTGIYGLHAYSRDMKKFETIMNDLSIDAGKNQKYLFGDSKLIKVSINAENGKATEAIEVLFL